MAKFKAGIPETFDIKVAPVTDLGDYLDENPPLPRLRKATQPKENTVVSDQRSSPIPPTTPAPIQTAPPAQQPQMIQAPTSSRVDVYDSGSAARDFQLDDLETPTVVSGSVNVANLDVQHSVVQQGRGAIISTQPIAPQQSFPQQSPQALSVIAPTEIVERPKRPKAPRREISMSPDTLEMMDELLEMIQVGSGQRDAKVNELMHALVALAHEVRERIDAHSIPKRGRWGTPTARAFPYEIKNAILKALIDKNGVS